MAPRSSAWHSCPFSSQDSCDFSFTQRPISLREALRKSSSMGRPLREAVIVDSLIFGSGPSSSVSSRAGGGTPWLFSAEAPLLPAILFASSAAAAAVRRDPLPAVEAAEARSAPTADDRAEQGGAMLRGHQRCFVPVANWVASPKKILRTNDLLHHRRFLQLLSCS